MSRAEIFRSAMTTRGATRSIRNAANTVADTLQGQNRTSQQNAIGLFRRVVMENPTPEQMELLELANDLAATTPLPSNAHR